MSNSPDGSPGLQRAIGAILLVVLSTACGLILYVAVGSRGSPLPHLAGGLLIGASLAVRLPSFCRSVGKVGVRILGLIGFST